MIKITIFGQKLYFKPVYIMSYFMLSVWSNYMDIRYEIIARLWHSREAVNLTLKRPVTVCPWCYLHHFLELLLLFQVLTSFLTSEELWSGSIKWSFLQFILTFAMRKIARELPEVIFKKMIYFFLQTLSLRNSQFVRLERFQK